MNSGARPEGEPLSEKARDTNGGQGPTNETDRKDARCSLPSAALLSLTWE